MTTLRPFRRSRGVLSWSSLALVAGLLLAPTTLASTEFEPWSWRNARIGGMGFVTGLRIDPAPPHTIAIKTDVGGVYRFDRGNGRGTGRGNGRDNARWIPMMDAFPRNERRALDIEAFDLTPGSPMGMVILAPREHPTELDVWGGRDAFGEVWRTLDGGATWTPLGLLEHRIRVAGNGEYRGFSGERIAVDPAQPERMIVASRLHGVWVRGSDGAWTQASGLPTVTPWVNPSDPGDESYGWNTPGHTFVLFDPSAGTLPSGQTRVVYVGDHETGIYRSDDGGLSFAPIAESPPYPTRATIAPDGTLYVSSIRQQSGPYASLPETGGLYRLDMLPSGSPGAWTEITPRSVWNPSQIDRRPYAGISVHPTEPSTIIASVSGGLDKLRSMDRGATWTRVLSEPIAAEPSYYPEPTAENYFIQPAMWGNCVMAFDPANPADAWTQNGFGVIRCENITGAQPSYAWVMDNLEELVMHAVLVPPVPFAAEGEETGGAAFISSCMDMMGFRHISADEAPTSRIGGGSGLPLQIGQAQGLAYSAQVPNATVFVGWDTWQPWRSLTGISLDNARTWTPFADTSPGIAGRVALSATDPMNIVWEPSQWKPLHVSFDGGASWTVATDVDAEFDPANPNWQTLGSAWHVSNPWWQGQHLVADRVNGHRFYRFTWGQWHASIDGGLHWTRGFSSWALGADAPPAYSVNTRLVPHPTREGEVWITAVPNDGNPDTALFRTTDGGETVSRVPSVDFASHVAFGKGIDDATPAIYIIGMPAGESLWAVYRSLDDGLTWTRLSDPNELGFARAASLDADMRRPGVVYVATSGRGILVGEAPVPPIGCTADLDADGTVDAADLAILLGAWGTTQADITGDGLADGSDLAILLGAWGACP